MARGSKALEKKIQVNDDGYVFTAVPAATIVDADLGLNQLVFWLDEATPALRIHAKKADGTVVTASVTLS